jgi:hypothetical protein
LKNKRFFEKTVADSAPIPYTKSVIRAGVLEQKFGHLVSRSKPGGFHHGEEEEESEDPEVIRPMSPPLSKTGRVRCGCRRSFGSSFAKKGPASCRPFCV